VAWIKDLRQGPHYFTPLGHTEIMYTDPRWTNHCWQRRSTSWAISTRRNAQR
jgi:hypothetical protein